MTTPVSNLTVLHIVGSIDPKQGGPSWIVPGLANHLMQARPSWECMLCTTYREVKGRCESTQLIHDHGQWMPLHHFVAELARSKNIPRIVSPHGMLSPWARNYKRLKKSIAWRLYAHRDLKQASVVCATSELELQELRELGVKLPIAVIANGVDPFPAETLELKTATPPYVLFLSRIHEKKGVGELLEVWEKINRSDWKLVLAGPDEQKFLASRTLPLGVKYVGMVLGEEKARLMRQASLFVLPTHSENFGVVVGESLLVEVPVITTHGAPWKSLQTERCGWWIPMEKPILKQALLTAMNTPAEELQAMGMRGRMFAAKAFAWPQLAEQMAQVYEWVLGGGDPPPCVDRG
jgi:glycosyltransferase involved in cell wall biosynthesis